MNHLHHLQMGEVCVSKKFVKSSPYDVAGDGKGIKYVRSTFTANPGNSFVSVVLGLVKDNEVPDPDKLIRAMGWYHRDDVPPANREAFERQVMDMEHGVYGWLSEDYLKRGDNEENYADEYMHGLWEGRNIWAANQGLLHAQVCDLQVELDLAQQHAASLKSEVDALRKQVADLEEARTARVRTSAPYPAGVEADLERSDWTPEQALRWYAEGKHFDTVDGRTRIIDTGAVASNALKHSSLEYLAMKGDAQLSELTAEITKLTRENLYLKAKGPIFPLVPDVNSPEFSDFEREFARGKAAYAGEFMSLNGFDRHFDDLAVQYFAHKMSEKMAKSREKGRHGWANPEICPDEMLINLFIGHLVKQNDGNLVDLACLLMMIDGRGIPAVSLGIAVSMAMLPPPEPEKPTEKPTETCPCCHGTFVAPLMDKDHDGNWLEGHCPACQPGE